MMSMMSENETAEEWGKFPNKQNEEKRQAIEHRTKLIEPTRLLFVDCLNAKIKSQGTILQSG